MNFMDEYFSRFVLLICLVTFNSALFGWMGESLNYNLKIKLYQEILHKQINWFDKQERAPGVLTSVFADNMEVLRIMTTETLETYFEAIITIMISLIIGYMFYPMQTIVVVLLGIFGPITLTGVNILARFAWGKIILLLWEKVILFLW